MQDFLLQKCQNRELELPMMKEPVLTVVLVTGNARERGQRALRSVLDQDGADQIVIFVYDRAYHPVRDLPEFSHPSVIYEAADRQSTLGQLQKQALFAAKTEIIAFIEEHVGLPPGWARETLRLHALGYTGVTGTFVPGNAHHHWARIGFLMTYGEYVFPSEGGETANIPADNASFIRSKLLKFEEDLELLFNTDVLLTRRLIAQGEKLYRAGNLSLKHSNESSLVSGWTSLFYWNQMYICNLVAVEKWAICAYLQGFKAGNRQFSRLAKIFCRYAVHIFTSHRVGRGDLCWSALRLPGQRTQIHGLRNQRRAMGLMPTIVVLQVRAQYQSYSYSSEIASPMVQLIVDRTLRFACFS
jgi:hypothetical protein